MHSPAPTCSCVCAHTCMHMHTSCIDQILPLLDLSRLGRTWLAAFLVLWVAPPPLQGTTTLTPSTFPSLMPTEGHLRARCCSRHRYVEGKEVDETWPLQPFPRRGGWIQRQGRVPRSVPLRSRHRPTRSQVPASQCQLQFPLPLLHLSHLKGVLDPAEWAVGHLPLCLLALHPLQPHRVAHG